MADPEAGPAPPPPEPPEAPPPPEEAADVPQIVVSAPHDESASELAIDPLNAFIAGTAPLTRGELVAMLGQAAHTYWHADTPYAHLWGIVAVDGSCFCATVVPLFASHWLGPALKLALPWGDGEPRDIRVLLRTALLNSEAAVGGVFIAPSSQFPTLESVAAELVHAIQCGVHFEDVYAQHVTPTGQHFMMLNRDRASGALLYLKLLWPAQPLAAASEMSSMLTEQPKHMAEYIQLAEAAGLVMHPNLLETFGRVGLVRVAETGGREAYFAYVLQRRHGLLSAVFGGGAAEAELKMVGPVSAWVAESPECAHEAARQVVAAIEALEWRRATAVVEVTLMELYDNGERARACNMVTAWVNAGFVELKLTRTREVLAFELSLVRDGAPVLPV
jgi:hypothetical protein